jgi:DNA repair protein RecO (recombination protein O)
MASHKSLGIVICRRNLFEADRILTIFTKDHGKIRVIAKGIRKLKSKLAGSLEPFSVINFSYSEGKNFDLITSAVIEENLYHLSDNCLLLSKAHYIGELIDKFTEEGEKNQALFEILRSTLQQIDHKNPLLLTFFEFKILQNLGFSPELFHCLKCRKDVVPGGQNRFSIIDSGIICADCQTPDGIVVSDRSIKLLRLMAEISINQTDRIKIQKTDLSPVENLIEDYLMRVIDRELRAKKVLKNLKMMYS